MVGQPAKASLSYENLQKWFILEYLSWQKASGFKKVSGKFYGGLQSCIKGVGFGLIDKGIEFLNKTKDWALVQNAASAGGVKVELGLFR